MNQGVGKSKNTCTPPRVWSDEDDAVLTKGWDDGLTAKQIARCLVNCTERMIQTRRATLKLPKRRLFGTGIVIRSKEKIIWNALLLGPCTRAKLRERAGVSRQSIETFVKENRARIHVCGWKDESGTGRWAEVLKAGAGMDKPKPAPIPKSVIYKNWYEKQKREHPDAIAARTARDKFHRQEREGKLPRRDPAAVALFGAPDSQASQQVTA